jgi:ATP-dependent DNA helicase RecG
VKEKELQLILEQGEGYKIEFKESLNNLDKEMVAFANASGGRVFLGIADNGRVKGVNITNNLKSRIQDIANNCRPKVRISFDTIDKILLINVREGEDKPYECSSGFYKRIGPNSQKMARDELLDFFKSEGKIRFDELIETKFSYPKDFDKTRFRRFLQLAEILRIDDTEKLLTSLGVAEKQEGKIYFNNAGILFFAREPQRFIPWSVFTVALFKDNVGVDIIDRKEIEGSLFEIVEEVMKFVRLYTKVAYRFTGKPQRENIYEYPFDAIREAVINSVMHKYYFEHGHNNILRFLPDRIRIENYWQKPSHFILGKTVFRRNHIIADLFSKIHFGEKMGTGFDRIREICKKENSPFPEIEFNENYFYVTFKQSHEYLSLAVKGKTAPKTTQKIPRKYPEELTLSQIEILELLEKDRSLTRGQMAKKLNISPETIKKNIEKLKQKKLLKRVGPDKGGYWEVLED